MNSIASTYRAAGQPAYAASARAQPSTAAALAGGIASTVCSLGTGDLSAAVGLSDASCACQATGDVVGLAVDAVGSTVSRFQGQASSLLDGVSSLASQGVEELADAGEALGEVVASTARAVGNAASYVAQGLSAARRLVDVLA